MREVSDQDLKDPIAGPNHASEITRLLHPEVRYEVTDNCNATCIMCPRDKHEHGREHGIMDQRKYEKSIDEIAALGAQKTLEQAMEKGFADRDTAALMLIREKELGIKVRPGDGKPGA